MHQDKPVFLPVPESVYKNWRQEMTTKQERKKRKEENRDWRDRAVALGARGIEQRKIFRAALENVCRKK